MVGSCTNRYGDGTVPAGAAPVAAVAVVAAVAAPDVAGPPKARPRASRAAPPTATLVLGSRICPPSLETLIRRSPALPAPGCAPRSVVSERSPTNYFRAARTSRPGLLQMTGIADGVAHGCRKVTREC